MSSVGEIAMALVTIVIIEALFAPIAKIIAAWRKK